MWEELRANWQGPSRTSYQGLIHVAVCLPVSFWKRRSAWCPQAALWLL
ncbi:MAG: hypothetical protein CMJ81_03960 [Planctomycetaceae bacterium]|nr:hypothetical protein [Planctomycetaceae bacterium]MBP60472.1 hypothetical protein [Planctomycetaceae bacterium]